jgi:DNA-directed RNA polymerase specialized sigma24 family protein
MDLFPEYLSPNLEWMLLGAQASDQLVLETLVKEYYPSAVYLALSIHANRDDAAGAALEGLVGVVRSRHQYRSGLPVRLFVYYHVIRKCTQILRRSALAGAFQDNVQNVHSKSKSTADSPPDNSRFVDRLEQISIKYRLPYLLYTVHQFTISEIAWLLQIKESDVRARMRRAAEWLSGGASKDASFEGLPSTKLVGLINERWSRFQLIDQDDSEWFTLANQLYLYQQKADQKKARLFQASLGFSAFVIVILIWWTTNRITSYELPLSRVASTVIVTQIVNVPVYITATPQAKSYLEPLSVHSSPSEIYQRILQSPGKWNTLWAEAEVFQNSLAGYALPPLIRREQIWISDPNNVLYLTGVYGENVNKIWLSPEGGFYSIDKNGLPQVQASQSTWFNDNPINSFFVLLPQDWFLEQKPIRVIGTDSVLDRESLIVESQSSDGQFLSRVWIEVNMGIILRLRLYAQGGNSLVADIYLTGLEIDKAFNPRIFQPDLMPTRFTEDYNVILADSQPGRQQGSDPPTISRPGSRITPPPAFDPVRSYLQMQWSQPQSDSADPLKAVGVEVFAGGYYLGQILLTNPGSAICKRSPDGRYLAIVEQSEQASVLPRRLRWLAVSNIARVNEALSSGGRYGNDFAFSPDSRSLAFWGCEGPADGCGVYIRDLVSGEVRNILPGRFSGHFIWSPDGSQLALSRSDEQLLVIDVDDGEILYTGEIDWTDLKLPADAPLAAWNVEYPPRQTDLTRCSQPGG